MPDNKEQELAVASKDAQVPIPESVEKSQEKVVSLEVESVIEKLERNVKSQGDDKQDDLGTVVQPISDQPAVTLPLTQGEVDEGEKLGMNSSYRWLVEWVKMMMEKLGKRGKYKKPSEDTKE